MYMPFSLLLIYAVWVFFYRFFSFLGKYLERLYWFFNPEHVSRGVSFYMLAPYYKLLAIYFYKDGSYKTFSFQIPELYLLPYIRAVRYPTAHLFFSRFAQNNVKIHVPNNLSYSIYKDFLKKFNPNNANHITKDFTYMLYFLSYKISENYNNFYYNTFFLKNRFNLVKCKYVYNRIVKNICSNKIYKRIDTNTVNGFIHFISSNNSFSLYKDYSKTRNKHLFNTAISKVQKRKILFVKKPFIYTLKLYSNFYGKKLGTNNTKLFALYYVYSDIFKKFNSKLTINTHFKNKLKKVYKILYRPSDVSQHLNVSNIKKYTVLYIRKNKIFNKGRYSRNRQLYRTGVYWCIWVNIIAVFGLYFYFYRFVFNFGYMWWPFFVLILSIFGNRLIKYRFYNYQNIVSELSYMQSILSSFLIHITHQTIPYLYLLLVRFVAYIRSLPRIIYNWFFR